MHLHLILDLGLEKYTCGHAPASYTCTRVHSTKQVFDGKYLTHIPHSYLGVKCPKVLGLFEEYM